MTLWYALDLLKSLFVYIILKQKKCEQFLCSKRSFSICWTLNTMHVKIIDWYRKIVGFLYNFLL